MRRRLPGGTATVLAALTLAYFHPLLLGRTLLSRDTFFDYRPWRLFARRAFLAGELPLWNPYSCAGKPFIANVQSAFFYPFNLAFYLLPFDLALSANLIGHVFLAGLFVALLLGSIGLGKGPALVGALSYMFGLTLISRLEFVSMLDCTVWTPLLLLLARRSVIVPSWGRTAALGAALAMQFASGYPNEMVFSLAILAAWWSAEVVRMLGAGGRDSRALSSLPVAALLGLGIVAVPFALTWELIPLSIRASQDAGLGQGSFHPWQLLTTIFPYLMGSPGYGGSYWAPTTLEYWLGAAFVGVVPMTLAAASCLGPPAPSPSLGGPPRDLVGSRNFFLLAAAGALLIAAGRHSPPFLIAYDALPSLHKFRWPSKAMSVFSLSVAALAGIGMEWACRSLVDIPRGGRHLRGLAFGSLLVATAAGLVTAWVAVDPAALTLLTGGADSRLRDLTAGARDLVRDRTLPGMARSVAFLGAGALAFGAAWRGKVGPRALAAIVAALAFANLYGEGRPLLLFAPGGAYDERPATVDRAAGEGEMHRVMGVSHEAQQFLYNCRDPGLYTWARAALVGDSLLPDRVYKDWGGDALRIADYVAFHGLMQARPDVPPRVTERFRDLASVRLIARARAPLEVILDTSRAGRDVSLVERPTALPRAFLVGSARVVADRGRILGTLAGADFDPRREVLIEEGANVGASSGGEVTGLRGTLNSTTVEVSCNGPAFLVLNDVFYPGWSASVDGIAAKLYRANWTFRAVRVPPGRHRVDFVYLPRHLLPCGLISLVSLVLVSSMIALGRAVGSGPPAVRAPGESQPAG